MLTLAPGRCVFCDIITGRRPRTLLASYPDAIVIKPLGPVTDGHALVIPRLHVADASQDAVLTGRVFEDAARYGRSRHESYNLITSVGAAASQTVFHLHIHVVPRRPGDGLRLPWGG